MSYVTTQLNVLVTPAGRACLADFGLTTVIDESQSVGMNRSTTKMGGTTRWQAPELFHGGRYDRKAADIYAFACVCYEVGCPVTPTEATYV